MCKFFCFRFSSWVPFWNCDSCFNECTYKCEGKSRHYSIWECCS